jgi:hypothetical protein
MARNSNGALEGQLQRLPEPGDIDLFASVKQYNVFEVSGDLDTEEGRRGTYVVGYYASEHLASLAARGKGVMGCSGTITHKTILTVTFKALNGEIVTCEVGNRIAISYESPADTRKQALAKLSPEEKKVLGLL